MMIPENPHGFSDSSTETESVFKQQKHQKSCMFSSTPMILQNPNDPMISGGDS